MHKAEIPIAALCNSNKAARLPHPQVTKGMAVLQWHGVTLPLTEVLKQLSLFDTNNTATYTCHPYPFALGKAMDSASCINEVTEYGSSAVATGTQATSGLEHTSCVLPYSSLQHLSLWEKVFHFGSCSKSISHGIYSTPDGFSSFTNVFFFFFLFLSPCTSMTFKNK